MPIDGHHRSSQLNCIKFVDYHLCPWPLRRNTRSVDFAAKSLSWTAGLPLLVCHRPILVISVVFPLEYAQNDAAFWMNWNWTDEATSAICLEWSDPFWRNMKIFDMQCVLHDQGSGLSCPAEGLIEVNVSENQARQLSVLVVGWEATFYSVWGRAWPVVPQWARRGRLTVWIGRARITAQSSHFHLSLTG